MIGVANGNKYHGLRRMKAKRVGKSQSSPKTTLLVLLVSRVKLVDAANLVGNDFEIKDLAKQPANKPLDGRGLLAALFPKVAAVMPAEIFTRVEGRNGKILLGLDRNIFAHPLV
jgi:hypothetical protein